MAYTEFGVQLLSDIDQRVEMLYAVFGRYERREHMESCPCCRGPESVRPLYDRPLRQLTSEDLHLYAFCAMTTMGDVDDFRYFLPRILELLKDSDFLASVDREVVLSKLRYGQWESWPEEEQEAVRDYLRSLWKLVLRTPLLASPYEQGDVGQWLCAVARAERNLSAYLELWRADRSRAAAANLAHFAAEHREELASSRPPSGYWEDAQQQWLEVAHWAVSEGLVKANAN
jgi:hypothetical protein